MSLLAKKLVIGAGVALTIDLNGHVLTSADEAKAVFISSASNVKPEIIDSVGDGKCTIVFMKASAAIRNDEATAPNGEKTGLRVSYTYNLPAGATSISLKWLAGVAENVLVNEIVAKNFVFDEETGEYKSNVVFNMSARNYHKSLYFQAVFTYEYDGVTYTVTDSVRSSSVIEVCTSYVNNNVSGGWKEYAERLIAANTAANAGN